MSVSVYIIYFFSINHDVTANSSNLIYNVCSSLGEPLSKLYYTSLSLLIYNFTGYPGVDCPIGYFPRTDQV